MKIYFDPHHHTSLIWQCQRRSAVWLLFILALTLGCGAVNKPLEFKTMLRCSNCPALTVERVIDGDTLDTNTGRVRLFGIDAPERGEKCFREATARLKELVGGTVKVEAGPRLQDPHGRLLYYVYTSSGYSVDAILIQNGLAHAWNRDGQHRDALVDMEANARSAITGCLWQS